MALTPEEVKERQRQAGRDVWKNKSSVERSEIMAERGRQRRAKMTKEERSESARHAALVRWERYAQGKK